MVPDDPSGACLHELVEAQARRTPDGVAIADGERRLTYRELDARAGRLAHYLRALGVGPGVPVGVCLHRSAEMVIAILAALKAGGCYVPLDPEYPAERLRELLDDCAPRVLLVDDAGAEAFARAGARDTARRCATLHVIADAGRWADAPAGGAAPRAASGVASDRDLAYIIYTSGSTGRPKGVMNEHRAVRNGLAWCVEAFALTERDVVLQKTPFTFDVSLWELFPPLMVGARLVMARPGGHRDPSYLCDVIRREGVTTLHFVPSMLRLFLEHEDGGRCTSVARVIAAGEALPAPLARTCLSRLPWAELHNLYGPTEAAVMSTAHRCAPGDDRASVPIGRPLANTRAHVLDAQMRPVPAGAAGELYLGGAQVARGYLHRPALTAERFVPDPFGDGARLYRTGDLARCLPGGAIDFLGRDDLQVKVRGFRIELGEIEAKLAQVGGVQEVAVVVREDVPGDQRLVAYYTGERAPDAGALRDHAARRLPEYMVPAAYVRLAALPLSPNGKLDRRALPPPPAGAHAGGAGDTRDHEAPRGELEEALARIWRELLGGPPIGRADDFFALGGHSLLAVRAAARIRADLGRDLPLRAVFDATTVAALAEEVARAPRLAPRAAPPPHLPRDQPLPLSPVQEGLWFLEQLTPGAYGELFEIRLTGPLDVDRLRRCLAAIADRHEALRSMFAARDGAPEVHLLASLGDPLTVAPPPDEAADADTDADADARLAARARREARRPFDLARGPLARFTLVPLGALRHALLCHVHHLVTDGASQVVLLAELAERLAADAEARPPRLPPLAVQYADHAARQRAELTEARRAELLDYWRGALAGLPPALELPTDQPRPPVPSHRGARHAFTIPAQLAGELRRLGARHGATPFMTLLALFQALLGRYAGRRDVVVGTPASIRDQGELEPLIGLLVNTVCVRLRFERGTTVGELLRRAREAVAGALAHRDLPFPDLVAGLAPARDPSRHPIAQIMFGLDPAPPAARAADLALACADVDAGVAKFDLSLVLAEQADGGLAGFLEYAADLWSPGGARQLAADYAALLADACRHPDAPVAHLALASTAPTSTAPGAAAPDAAAPRAPARPPRDPASAIAQIERRMARAPDRIAIAADGETITYGELDRRSALLGRALAARGLGPDRRIAIVSDRSPAALIAILAALRAGGAYAPIDPRLPRERIARMLRELDPVAVLGPGELADEPAWRAHPTAPLAAAPPEALAYVLYTSGSTGVPKGVMIERRGLDAQLGWMQEEYRLAPDDRFLQLASLMFDFSVLEILWPLLVGACVVLPRPRGELEPAYLAALARDRGATAVHFVPSMLRVLVDEPAPAPWDGIRLLFSGGEALSPELARRCRAVFPRAELHNQYGPTEATINATACRIDPAPGGEPPVVPIGRPVPDLSGHVVDDALAPAPRGAVGELALSGVQLARGYLGRPAETAERFVPSPFARTPGERLYLTGDLVRARPGGDLEYVGRSDFQVKVRGFRIELGEIEAALAAHPAIRRAVCIADGAARLVGYVEWRDAPAPTAELDRLLGDRLPDYMIPSAYVAVAAWPLTPAGKLDRAALPAPSISDGTTAAGPMSPAEREVAAVWSELLGAEVHGPDADFFQLGGTSLLAMRAASRLERATGRPLPVLALFQARTVRRVAALLTTGDNPADPADPAATTGTATTTTTTTAALEIPPLAPRPDPERWPLTSSQRMAWELTHRLRQSVFEWPLRVFELRGPLDRAALRRAADAVAMRHPVLRARFSRTNGDRDLVQLVAPAPVHGWYELEVPPPAPGAPGAPATAPPVPPALLEQLDHPFDLTCGPVLRLALASASADHHWLGFAAHHIAFDGASLAPFFTDLSGAYRQLAAGQPVAWSAPALALADVAAWEQAVWRTAGPAMARYWRERLAGAQPAPLPFADTPDAPAPRTPPQPAPSLTPARVHTRSFKLAGAAVERLRRAAAALGSTPFIVALTSLGATIRALTGANDLCIASPYARRDLEGAARIVGYMAHPLLIRLDGPTGAPFAHAVAHTGARVLEAYRHGHVPLVFGDDVLPGLPGRRALGGEALYRIFFNYLRTAGAPLDLGPGVAATPVDLGPESETRFPLMVFAVETERALTWSVVAQARCYEPAQVAALAERIGRDLERALAADPLESP